MKAIINYCNDTEFRDKRDFKKKKRKSRTKEFHDKFEQIENVLKQV